MHFSRIVSSDLYAQKNHPTQEHLLPLFVAIWRHRRKLRPERIHASYMYSVLAIDRMLLATQNSLEPDKPPSAILSRVPAQKE
jgi:hypothetical protein